MYKKTVYLYCHCTKSSEAIFWFVCRTVWNCLQLLKVDVDGESAQISSLSMTLKHYDFFIIMSIYPFY